MKSVVIDGVKYVPEVDPLAEVKAAHREGKAVQFLSQIDDTWRDNDTPSFNPEYRWRIKPEPKPDVVVHGRAQREKAECTGMRTAFHCFGSQRHPSDNLKLTFNADGQLIRAEVL